MAGETIGCDIDGPAITASDAATFAAVAAALTRAADGRSTVSAEIQAASEDRRQAIAQNDFDGARALWGAILLLTPHAIMETNERQNQ